MAPVEAARTPPRCRRARSATCRVRATPIAASSRRRGARRSRAPPRTRCTASAGFPLPSCATAGANRTNPASAPGSVHRARRAASQRAPHATDAVGEIPQFDQVERRANPPSARLPARVVAREMRRVRPRQRVDRGRGSPRRSATVASRSRSDAASPSVASTPARARTRRPSAARPRPRGPRRVRWTRSCRSPAGRPARSRCRRPSCAGTVPPKRRAPQERAGHARRWRSRTSPVRTTKGPPANRRALRAVCRSRLDGVDVQRDAGAERGRHGALLDVTALGARRLETHDLFESGLDVLVELLGRERRPCRRRSARWRACRRGTRSCRP